ncbi:hypothetical protein EMIHUDRAFT_211898 [Emiliania huxleyi CCMP1516]|uniref:IPT/TIG domain-containing protein n=2 Tax=Emiliania huxleyi TaxID=2903 RepID=A0A0D3IT54_EMIH1|nr:hypothetical protein EMIHUDRAFT_211898 [Emiliania huxleyi CCMP1516]EOD14439.1 hypothetical protein EMIHUDRAFT_211898 [Emiliania huxleyi CCMP1516]|eukprot:XP_005766868.1 hypothetical protein EMIHUDRAFT_211898 [Emiliania huxleyi CCMP1516]
MSCSWPLGDIDALAVTGGAELDVLGTGFDAAALGRNIVSIGQMGCLVLDASPNRLRCRTQATNASAAGAAATLVVSILDDHGALRANASLPDDSTQALSFLPLEATPSVSGFDQPWMATGSAAGGQELCVLGVRLDEVARVLLGQAPCTNVTATSDGTSLCCTTSVAGEVGAVPIVALTNSSGAALVGAGVDYEYVEAPTFTAVSPIQGYAGVVATIHGTGLCGAGGSNGTVCDDPLPEVRVGGALCEIVAAHADAVLVVVPAGAPSEHVCDYSWCPNGELVTVHVPRVGAALAAPPQETDADVPIFQMSDDGGRLVVPSRTAGAVRFRYVPAVVAVEPKVVSLAGGVDLTIHGSGFSHLSALRVSLLSREALADLDRPLGPARNSWANTASTRALNLTCGSPAFGGAEAIERRPPSWRPASYRSIVCRAPPLYATEEEYQRGQREDRVLFIHVEWRRRPRCTGCEPWSEGAACAVPGSCVIEYTAARTPVIDIVRPQEGGAGTAITILGSGFGPTAADNSVSLGDQPCAVVSAARDRIVTSEGYYHGLNVRGYPMLKFERNGLTVHSVSGMVDPEAASAHVTVLDRTTGLALAQASITAEIELSGSNDGSATGLQACTGECDNDGQCGSGLRCFQRDNGEKIPGCKGNGGGPDWDYCYGAIESDALALLSTLGGFPSDSVVYFGVVSDGSFMPPALLDALRTNLSSTTTSVCVRCAYSLLARADGTLLAEALASAVDGTGAVAEWAHDDVGSRTLGPVTVPMPDGRDDLLCPEVVNATNWINTRTTAETFALSHTGGTHDFSVVVSRTDATRVTGDGEVAPWPQAGWDFDLEFEWTMEDLPGKGGEPGGLKRSVSWVEERMAERAATQAKLMEQKSRQEMEELKAENERLRAELDSSARFQMALSKLNAARNLREAAVEPLPAHTRDAPMPPDPRVAPASDDTGPADAADAPARAYRAPPPPPTEALRRAAMAVRASQRIGPAQPISAHRAPPPGPSRENSALERVARIRAAHEERLRVRDETQRRAQMVLGRPEAAGEEEE